MRVLFIGNSHTFFNDMPALFASMCEQLTGEKPEVTMLAYSGRTLRWHCEESFSIRFVLLYGAYAYCVVQERAHPFPEAEETIASAERIFSLCQKAGTKPVVYMPWAKKDEPEMLDGISKICRKLAKDHEALLLPAGELFRDVHLYHPEIELYWEDGAHSSPYGDYLIAAALAGMLTGCKDLHKLNHTGFAFHNQFEGGDGYPHAEEDIVRVPIELDEVKTGNLLEEIGKSI